SRPAPAQNADGHAGRGVAVGVVRRAVERIEDPKKLRASKLGFVFFRLVVVLRKGAANDAKGRALALEVRDGDEVGAALLAVADLPEAALENAAAFVERLDQCGAARLNHGALKARARSRSQHSFACLRSSLSVCARRTKSWTTEDCQAAPTLGQAEAR